MHKYPLKLTLIVLKFYLCIYNVKDYPTDLQTLKGITNAFRYIRCFYLLHTMTINAAKVMTIAMGQNDVLSA